MIININSWPGVGKLTLARHLQKLIGGRLLDNHTVFNVAFSLCEFRSPEFYETVRAVRHVAYEAAARLPAHIPVILTSAYSQGPWSQENWGATVAMASKRGSQLYSVVLDCSLDENIRRLQSAERGVHLKLTDPVQLATMRREKVLMSEPGDHHLQFDVTDLKAAAAADKITEWLTSRSTAAAASFDPAANPR
jgi:predicted kinase